MEAKGAEVKGPEAKEPEAEEPETKRPEAQGPEVWGSEAQGLEAKGLEAKELEAKGPEDEELEAWNPKAGGAKGPHRHLLPNDVYRWSRGRIEALKFDGDILKSMFGATACLELTKLEL